LWRENPVVQQHQEMPIGWVLEYEGRIVGYLGSIPMHYYFQGKRLLAVAARGFVVDAPFRGHSLRLLAAFFSQKNVDLWLNTSANEAAGSVFQLCKAEKIPYQNYDTALFWIVSAQGFVSSILRSRGYGPVFSAIARNVLVPMIRFEGYLRQRGPLCDKRLYEMSVLEPQNVGVEFNEFWQSTLKERSQCLLSERSASVLRWHFGHRAATERRAKFVCARHKGKLVGYAVITREDSERIGLMRACITDLIAEKDAAGLVDALLKGAFRQARIDGAHILELIGFPERIRTRFVAGKAYVRHLPSWRFWYKTAAVDLRDSLKCEDVWYGSSYDGDASL